MLPATRNAAPCRVIRAMATPPARDEELVLPVEAKSRP